MDKKELLNQDLDYLVLGEHMTEGALESLPETDNIRSLEVSSDDGRAFLSIERRMEIVKIINMHKSATVAEIVEWIGASPATVRRDLTWLDEQGLIMRTP